MWQNKTHSFPWRAAKNNIGSAGMWSSEEFATWMSQNGDSIFTSSVNSALPWAPNSPAVAYLHWIISVGFAGAEKKWKVCNDSL